MGYEPAQRDQGGGSQHLVSSQPRIQMIKLYKSNFTWIWYLSFVFVNIYKIDNEFYEHEYFIKTNGHTKMKEKGVFLVLSNVFVF